LNPQTHQSLVQRAATAVLVLFALLPVGCGGASPAADAHGRVTPAYDAATGKLTRLAYDSDDNGTDDTWASMDGTRLVSLEADENEDGQIDRWEFYPPDAKTGPRQAPERIERATRLDGRVSRREFFEQGVMTRVEEDTDADGALVLLALDTAGRGQPDRRFVYRADGSLERMEADRDGRGTFEVVK
jgi:hypothetical protein